MMHEVKTIPEVLSGRVRQVRERRGISLRELSRRIDDLGYTPIDASGLMRLENGTRRATVEDVISISMALDVAPVSLLAPLSDEKVFLPGLGERDAHDVRGWIAGGFSRLNRNRHHNLTRRTPIVSPGGNQNTRITSEMRCPSKGLVPSCPYPMNTSGWSVEGSQGQRSSDGASSNN